MAAGAHALRDHQQQACGPPPGQLGHGKRKVDDLTCREGSAALLGGPDTPELKRAKLASSGRTVSHSIYLVARRLYHYREHSPRKVDMSAEVLLAAQAIADAHGDDGTLCAGAALMIAAKMMAGQNCERGRGGGSRSVGRSGSKRQADPQAAS